MSLKTTLLLATVAVSLTTACQKNSDPTPARPAATTTADATAADYAQYLATFYRYVKPYSGTSSYFFINGSNGLSGVAGDYQGPAFRAYANSRFDFPGYGDASDTQSALGTVPLYHLWRFDSGAKQYWYFYTTNAQERQLLLTQYGYQDGGIEAYVFPTQAANTVPLYRLHKPNTGSHFFTTSNEEADRFVSQNGYVREGIACYVYPKL